MHRIPGSSRPHLEADPSNFEMPALMQRLLGADDGVGARLYRVTFAEGSRTHWHVHDAPQLLFGLSGRCLVVSRDGTELPLGPGDLVVIQPGEEHWHGAAPDSAGEHLAINLGETTTWLGA